MRISTSEAARRLQVHPAKVVLQVSEMVGHLSECWPELDDGFVETLRTLQVGHLALPPQRPVALPVSPREAIHVPRPQTQMRVLDKLLRHNKWGGASVSLRTLKNDYCRGLEEIDEAVHTLVDEGLVLQRDGHDGPFSLNPARKGDIERIVADARRP